MSDSPDLLPCPFCGGSASIRSNHDVGNAWVSCDACLAQSGGFQDTTKPHHILRDLAAEEWNRRTASPPVGIVGVETDAQIKDATTEYLSHRGERPYRILRGGQELWETHVPAMREAFRASRRASLTVGTEPKTCQRCQGNGEIVTDWDRYRTPHNGDVGDEAVAECPDCDGAGVIQDAGAKDDDPVCTDCGGTGTTYQTERRCACQSATPPQEPSVPATESKPVEWLWWGSDENGREHISFGRWQRHPCQYRYKFADPQATEHDHPKRSTALPASEIADLVANFSAPPEPSVQKPVAWQWRSRSKGKDGWHDWSDWHTGRREPIHSDGYESEERPLFDRPSPSPAGDRSVKALQWTDYRQAGNIIESHAPDGFDGRYVCYDSLLNSSFSLVTPDKALTQHDSLAEAKAKAQADYEQRILAALFTEGPDHG